MATNPVTTLRTVRGDDFSSLLTIKNNGVVMDLTDSTVTFTIKENTNVLDSNASYQQVITAHTDPTAGQTTISIPRADSANLALNKYVYDVQLLTSGDKLITVLRGDFYVDWDVTKSV